MTDFTIRRHFFVDNLAIIDPLTGFYSVRFFLLQLEEKLKSKQDLTLVALKLADYKRISLKLNFEQIKLLIRLFSEHLQSQVDKQFSKPIFSLITNDTIGIILQRAKKKI